MDSTTEQLRVIQNLIEQLGRQISEMYDHLDIMYDQLDVKGYAKRMEIQLDRIKALEAQKMALISGLAKLPTLQPGGVPCKG